MWILMFWLYTDFKFIQIYVFFMSFVLQWRLDLDNYRQIYTVYCDMNVSIGLFINTLRPRQMGRLFLDIFNCIFLIENV